MKSLQIIVHKTCPWKDVLKNQEIYAASEGVSDRSFLDGGSIVRRGVEISFLITGEGDNEICINLYPLSRSGADLTAEKKALMNDTKGILISRSWAP